MYMRLPWEGTAVVVLHSVLKPGEEFVEAPTRRIPPIFYS